MHSRFGFLRRTLLRLLVVLPVDQHVHLDSCTYVRICNRTKRLVYDLPAIRVLYRFRLDRKPLNRTHHLGSGNNYNRPTRHRYLPEHYNKFCEKKSLPGDASCN